LKILVTGGCGYIGSHTIVDLIKNDFEVLCLDSNIRSSSSILQGVSEIVRKEIKNHPIDLCDFEATKQFFEANQDIVGIIHFAALKSVGESTAKPLLYHQNNIVSLLNLLQCVKDYNIPNFIFSSSCSVYGNAEELPVTENTPLKEAESPYARTKQVSEYIIQDFYKTHTHLNSIILRYFNPAGAHPSLKIGERQFGKPVSLVPVITDTALGKRDKITVFGTDYDTRDGSCIRDYIYIMDLANAHTKSVEYLLKGDVKANCDIINLGAGEGVTVLEMLNAFEKTTGVKLNYELGERRDGDVIAVYADYTKANQLLGWKPQYTVDDIMKTAWGWEQKSNH
jgi:UDP-glucose 4-epimerase